MAHQQDLMEKIVSLAKRRGFIYPSSEIYGGINGFWDYGPLGVELKRNIKDAWWHDIVSCPAVGPDGQPIRMVGLDCSIIMNPKAWEASGHLAGFADPMIDDKETKQRFRADQLTGAWLLGESDKREWDVRDLPAVDILDLAVPNLTFVEDNPSIALHAFMEGYAKNERLVVVETFSRHLAGRSIAQLVVSSRKPPHNFQKWAFRLVPQEMLRERAAEIPSPYTGKKGTLTQPRQFNLMFQTYYGAVFDDEHKAYLRPETAQGIFANYKNVLDTTRIKVPFGIAQIGKAFRNEINPRNFTFRSREFEQMEIEFFCHPGQADKWYEYWRDARFKWYTDHGLKSSRLRLRNHEKEELAHYARSCADIEYEFPFGISELEGVANRTDFDLKAHQNHPACLVKDLSYFDDETKERFIPYVIEPSGGVDRATLAFLCEAYAEDEAPDENGAMQKRTVLRFHPRLAPVKVAVFPLVRKDGMPEKAQAIYQSCAKHIAAFYDEKGAVGRRYRRQDEAGTPFCVTVDGQTSQDGTVTIRDRDTMQQVRIPAEGVLAYVRERLHI
jgi:glycyl-tRNA synthetase